MKTSEANIYVTVRKSEKFTHRKKIRQINYLLSNFFSKTLFSLKIAKKYIDGHPSKYWLSSMLLQRLQSSWVRIPGKAKEKKIHIFIFSFFFTCIMSVGAHFETFWAIKMGYQTLPLISGALCRVTKTIFFLKKGLYLFQFWSYTKILEYGKVWELYISFKLIKIFWKFSKISRSFKK